MVLLIRATSVKGRPPDQDLSARFEESGGTIGRGEKNTLVLPDPERFISRVHATVSFQAGGFILTGNGTKNPVVHNGKPLGPGSQARLGEGDTIEIGDYVLEVSLPSRGVPPTPPPASTAKDDPFAQSAPSPVSQKWPEPSRPREPAPPASDPLVSVRPPEPHIDELLGSKPPVANPLASASSSECRDGETP